MASGGARALSGPAPDPNALRRDRDGGSWVKLPAAGRVGDPPVWPLNGFTDREKFFWSMLWKTPQATEWEKAGIELEVALHARALAVAEKPKAPIAAFTLVRQQMEALGLTLPGMSRLRWKIVAVPALSAVPDEKPAATVTPIRKSARDRMTVMGDGAKA